MLETILQYLLGYCTWWGLATIGELPLTECLPPDFKDRGIRFNSARNTPADGRLRNDLKGPMPVWMILIFFGLVAARYILCFLVSSVYLLYMFNVSIFTLNIIIKIVMDLIAIIFNSRE